MSFKYMKKAFDGMEPYFSKNLTSGVILNANEAPYLPPKKILDEYKAKVNNMAFNRYPDMAAEELCASIAKYHDVKPENITVGVGSDELLDVVFRCVISEGDEVVSFSPSFSMYQIFTELVGGKFVPVYPKDNFMMNVNDMIRTIIAHNPKLVLICSPNNPTGQFFTKFEVEKICKSTDALVLLDLAYIDFAGIDYSDLASKYDNVIVFRTFSKALALPSIRLGYAISNKENIDMINAVKAPYSVTMQSLELGKIAIDNKKLYKPLIEEIKSEREVLYKFLKDSGYEVYPSEANFIFLKLDKKVNEYLTSKEIYIRTFKNGYSRITVGSKEENIKLMEALKEYESK